MKVKNLKKIINLISIFSFGYIAFYIGMNLVLSNTDLMFTRVIYLGFLVALGVFLLVFPLRNIILYYGYSDDESSRGGFLRTIKIFGVLLVAGVIVFGTYFFTEYGVDRVSYKNRNVVVVMKSYGFHNCIAEFYEPYMGVFYRKLDIPNQLLDGPNNKEYSEFRVKNDNY
ncbi:MAG: hypothetical protein RR840_03660 [Clostridium sp.]